MSPLPDEDVATRCVYELTCLDAARPVQGVWVIFERGRDMSRYYGDKDVHAFARRHDLALLMPFHCAGKPGGDGAQAGGEGDINVDPARGLGRALLASLNQFAQLTSHPELSSARLILLGFSGTGSLVARFAAFAPDRLSAIIASDPAHGERLGMDTISLSAQAMMVPQLVLVGGADAVSGTERPYQYFRKYFDRGAPWTFVAQNDTPHCCIINAKTLVLQLDAVVIRRLTPSTGWFGFFRTKPTLLAECPSAPPFRPVWCRGNRDIGEEPRGRSMRRPSIDA